MITYFVLKDCHYSNFIPFVKCFGKEVVLERIFSFQKSCIYEIDEHSCVNKLFGFCFGFGVHRNSVRFGWTYDKKHDMIAIWKYVYDNGKLNKDIICFIELERFFSFKIRIRKYSNGVFVTMFVDGKKQRMFEIKADSCFITTLGLYFGGNTPAPHTIKVRRL